MSAITSQTSSEARPAAPADAKPGRGDFWARVALTLAFVVAYYAFRADAVEAVLKAAAGFLALDAAGPWFSEYPLKAAQHVVRASAAVLAAALLLSGMLIWRPYLARDKRWHAPLLVVAVLVMADAGFSILESHPLPWLAELTGGRVSRYSPTFVAILTAVTCEAFLGRFVFGKWPHLASSFVSGISAGILVKSPELWPFVTCALLSITSKYVLRIGERHLWNPTNFGMTAMLFFAPNTMASLSVEAGNELAAAAVIWILGGMILYRLGLFHVPLAFVTAFVALAGFRAYLSGSSWLTEVAPITSPMFQLYIFFMITDPKTTTRRKWSQAAVAVMVAVMETTYRVAFRDVHSLYHALFTVGPIANLIEMGYERYLAPWREAWAGGRPPAGEGVTTSARPTTG